MLGNSIGETEIHVFNSYGLREIWTVKVLPKPNPIEINCEINVGEQCYFNGMRRTGQYLYESNP